MIAHRLALLSLLASCSAGASPWSGSIAKPSPEWGAVVPTEMCRGYFFVPVVVGEDPDAEERTLWFIYDTGADTTHVDPDSLERATGKRVATGRTARFDARSGPISYERFRARVRDLDHLSTALGREIDGILAYGVFDQFLLTLDYGREEMRIDPGTLPEPDGTTVFSVSGPDDRPWLRVKVGEHDRRMLIDSGAATTTFAVRNIEDYATVAPPRPVGASVRFKHIERRRGARLDGAVVLGPHRLDRPTLGETPGNELIGGEVMQHFVWTFDAANERVRIERIDPEATIEFPPVVTHGMVVVPEDGRLRVHEVIADSPAAAGGVRAEDVITHWNGAPVATRGCDPGSKDRMTLNVLRDGESVELDVPLFALVE